MTAAKKSSAAKKGIARRVGKETAPGVRVAQTVANKDAQRASRAPSVARAQAIAAKKNSKPVLVKVTNTRGGWYGLKRQRYGETFVYNLGEGELLPSWVVAIDSTGNTDPSVPVRRDPRGIGAAETDTAGRVISDVDEDEDIEELAKDEDELPDANFTPTGRHTNAALRDRTDAELVELAKSQYGLELDPLIGRDKIISAIVASQEASGGIAPGPRGERPAAEEDDGSGDGE